MEHSHIQWTDHTFNPWEGCTKVSPGCAHCYAEARNQRWSGGKNWGKGAPRRRTSAANWKGPLQWNRKAMAQAVISPGFYNRPRVFCASLADWLDAEVETQWLADLMTLIRSTPNLDWLLLTKRPQNFFDRLKAVWSLTAGEENTTGGFCYDWGKRGIAPLNVWLGTTVEDQERADIRIPQLLAIPARVRFLSCEPLLCEINIREHLGWTGKGSGLPNPLASALESLPDIASEIHWAICGGESGHGAREMNPDWARELRFQCENAGVAFFMKQMGGIRDARGELTQIPEDLRIRQFPQLTAAKD